MPGPSPTTDPLPADPRPADLLAAGHLPAGHVVAGSSPPAADPGDLGPAVLDGVREVLVEVIGPEYLLGLSIDMDTSLDHDLQLESLEFVALAERLPQRFGDRVDVVTWLASKELDEIIALTVGDLVELVVSALAPAV